MMTPTLQAGPALLRRDWKPLYWITAMLTLLTLQLASGTMPAFALLMTLFCLLTYLAIKQAGGLATVTGLCIFCLAFQNVLISQIAKVAFWDPADHKLIQPLTTVGVYVCAMAGIYLASLASRRLGTTRRRPLFLPITDPTRLMWIAWISTAIFAFQLVYITKGGTDAESGAHNFGGLVGILQQFSFLGLAVTSGTAYMITASQGRRSLGLVNLIAIGVPFVGGILGASREGLTSATVMYFVTCFMFRFRFRFINYAALIGGVCFAQYILFPYALYARDFVRTPDMQKNIQVAYSILLDVISDPVHYQKMQEGGRPDRQIERVYEYYGKPSALLDRYTLIKVTDGLVDATLREGTTGMDTITPGFYMMLPRFILPDKPYIGTSNMLAHREPGLVGKNDHGTGITTGFAGDAFSSYGWAGAVAIPFLLVFGWFCGLRYVLQDSLWKNIFGLSLLVQTANTLSASPVAPLLTGMIINPLMNTVAFWLVLRLASFAMRTQEKILAAKQQAIVRDRSEVLAGRRHPSRRRLLIASGKNDRLP